MRVGGVAVRGNDGAVIRDEARVGEALHDVLRGASCFRATRCEPLADECERVEHDARYGVDGAPVRGEVRCGPSLGRVTVGVQPTIRPPRRTT